ncbi:hypothetical protein ACMD2_14313, partial [Ananas comosus]
GLNNTNLLYILFCFFPNKILRTTTLTVSPPPPPPPPPPPLLSIDSNPSKPSDPAVLGDKNLDTLPLILSGERRRRRRSSGDPLRAVAPLPVGRYTVFEGDL